MIMIILLLLHLGGVGLLGVQQPLREISDLTVSAGVVPQVPGAFGGAHGVPLDDHLRDVGCRGVCQRFEGGHDLCGHLGQETRVPGLLSQRPEQALRLVRNLAVLGALLAQNPPQAVIPDLPVQAVQALNAHLRRLMDVLEQLDIVHIGSPRS